MTLFKSCILAAMLIAVSSGFMGCSKKNDTLAQVTVAPANQSMALNTTLQFTATGTFTNGMEVIWTQVVNWSSSDPTVATVDNIPGSSLSGVVRAQNQTGTTVITAYDVANNITGTALVTVTNPESIAIYPANPYMAVNSSFQLSAFALFTNGTVTQVITTYATWTVLSPGLVTIIDTPGVVGNGIVTALAVPGTTIIQATDPVSLVTATTTLTIKSTPLASIAIDQINPIISLYTTASSTTQQQFTATGTFGDGTTTAALPPQWAWTSSNTAIATIDYYTGLATAVAVGASTITAKDPVTGIAASTTLTIQ